MDEAAFLVHPNVRRGVVTLAKLGNVALIASCICGVLGFLLLFFVPFAREFATLLIVSGTHLFLLLHLFCLAWVAPWCVMVLLTHRGNILTRCLGGTAIFFASFMLLIFFYLLFSGKQLLANQNETPNLVLVALFLMVVFSTPVLGAASVLTRVRLYLHAPLMMLVLLLGESGMLLPESIVRLGLLWTSLPLLRGLADIAPRIVDLPPKD